MKFLTRDASAYTLSLLRCIQSQAWSWSDWSRWGQRYRASFPSTNQGINNTLGPTPGSDGITSVTGPMARSVEDLELVCRVVFGQEGRLQMPPPLTYRDVHLPAKLKLGYYTSDDFAKASPPCKRAVLETVEALRRAGHECVEFSIPSRACSAHSTRLQCI